MAEAYIVDAVRTAGGRRGGRLKDWHPADLGGFLVDALLERTQSDPELVEDLIFGCVTQAGEQAFNIARAVGLSSTLPLSTPATSIDRQCGSSQQAVHFAAQAVISDAADIVIAGGVESMTRVPMGLAASLPAKNGFGQPYGSRVAKRFDNAEFGQFRGAEMMARKYGLSKDRLDAYAYESHNRAARASSASQFSAEIVPVPVIDATGVQEWHTTDEGVRPDASLDAIRNVKLLEEGGLLTAATSSQICDGASAALICNERGLKRLGRAPLGRIHHMSVLGGDPVIMLEAPIPATQRALQRSGLRLGDIDLYEVNEAFASVPLAWLQALDADPSRLNVNGGAIALGHPLGASGGRLVATLLHALKHRGQRYGLQTMCEGGGMANVTVFERL
jgi:acetyl-CoA C-acetyltransferase